jgi:hypothetical protein
MAQGSGILLHSIHLFGGVADVVGLVLAEGFQVRFREKSAICQGHKQGFDAMSFARDVAITIRVFEIGRIHLEHSVVEHIEDIHAGKASSGMSGFCFIDVFEKVFSQENRLLLQFIVGHSADDLMQNGFALLFDLSFMMVNFPAHIVFKSLFQCRRGM